MNDPHASDAAGPVPARGHLFFGSRFAAVGVINTLVGLGTIYAMKWLFGLHDAAANVIGYAAGLCVSFALNRNWTFGDRGRAGPAALRFLGIFCIAYPLNLLCVLGLIEGLGVNAYVAQALGIPPYTTVFYLANRYFVFRKIGHSSGGPT